MESLNQENTMRGIGFSLGTSALAGLLFAGAVSRGEDVPKEKKIALPDIPQKVMDAAKGRLPGADVTSAEKELENGNVVYDLELKQKGRKYEMDVKEDGTILEIEKQVAARDVPRAVTKAIKSRYPRTSIKEVMEVNLVKNKKETPDHYEVVLGGAGGKDREVVVSLDGASVKEESGQ